MPHGVYKHHLSYILPQEAVLDLAVYLVDPNSMIQPGRPTIHILLARSLNPSEYFTAPAHTRNINRHISIPSSIQNAAHFFCTHGLVVSEWLSASRSAKSIDIGAAMAGKRVMISKMMLSRSIPGIDHSPLIVSLLQGAYIIISILASWRASDRRAMDVYLSRE